MVDIIPDGWSVVGFGDFNGDGISDVLLRSSDGTITDWLGTGDGGFFDNSAHASSSAAGNVWQVVGVGDFSGSGHSDILWRNSVGSYVTDWLGTGGGSFTDNSAIAGNGAADNSWQVVGTGDFNGDGISDILWRNESTGFVTDWLGSPNGGFTDNSAHAGNGTANANWSVAGVSDFNGDIRPQLRSLLCR